jgi:hypothetical protein
MWHSTIQGVHLKYLYMVQHCYLKILYNDVYLIHCEFRNVEDTRIRTFLVDCLYIKSLDFRLFLEILNISRQILSHFPFCCKTLQTSHIVISCESGIIIIVPLHILEMCSFHIYLISNQLIIKGMQLLDASAPCLIATVKFFCNLFLCQVFFWPL